MGGVKNVDLVCFFATSSLLLYCTLFGVNCEKSIRSTLGITWKEEFLQHLWERGNMYQVSFTFPFQPVRSIFPVDGDCFLPSLVTQHAIAISEGPLTLTRLNIDLSTT